MAGSDVQITLGADASAAVQGLTQFGASLATLAPQVANLAKAFAGLASNLTQLTSSVTGLANGLRAAGAQGGEGFAALQKGSGGAAAAVGSVTDKVTGLLKNAGDLGRGLKSAGVQGTGALIAMGDEAAPAAAAVGAVVSIVLSAADAMAQWAQRTATASTATADAREKAQDLNTAFGQARTAFQQAGDAIATSLAPTFTVLVSEAGHLAQVFVDDYNKGGLLKTAIDLLVGALKLALIPPLTLAEAFELAWIRISGSWDEMGDKWKLVQDVFNAGVKGIEANFATLARAIGEAIAGDWVDAAKDALQGVSAAVNAVAKSTPQIQQDLEAINRDEAAVGQRLTGNFNRYLGYLGELSGLGGPAQQGGPPAPADTAADIHPGPAKEQQSAPSASDAANSPDGCGCDPATAKACAADAASAKSDAVETGEASNLAVVQTSNAEILADNQLVSTQYLDNLRQEVSATVQAALARADAMESANNRIRQSNDQTLKQFESSMKGVVNTFASGLAKMVEGGESFGKVMSEVGQKILDDVFRVVIGMVEKWAWGETEKVLATTQGQALLNALGLRELAVEILNDQKKVTAAVGAEQAKNAAKSAGAAQGLAIDGATALKSVVNDAVQAATGAYQGVLKVVPPPFGIPVAAGAAAAAFAAVMAFRGLISSAAGGFDIPAGVNPLTQLHAQEMVLPARLANPLRDMLAGFGSGDAPSAGGHTFSFGDTHIHGAPNMSPAEFRQALAEHRASVAEAVASALHGGWRPSYRQPVGAL